MSVDLVLCNAKAYVGKKLVDCSFAINEGKILKIGKEANMPKAETKIDLKNLLVLPGLIDVHVHLRDEGKAYKEDFYSGTAAAVAGGIATVLDMPNNNPVTMSVEALKNRMKKAEKKILVNVGFYSEFPKKNSEIEKIVTEGAVAFKLFMAEQVGGLNIDDDSALLEAFKIAAEMKVPIAVHAEDRSSLKEAEHKFKRANCNDIHAFLKAHSESVEAKAVKRILNITKQIGAHIHFCHVSTEDGLKVIVDEKKKGTPITCEATPHHLLISSDELKQIGTLALTMPPIREKHHLTALWDGIKNGWIDIIASDHAPHALEEKKAKTVWDVKVGVPGLETTLPLMLTEVNRGRLSIADIVSLMAEKPAEVFKLPNKGYLKEGYSADLTVIDLNKKYRIDASKFHSKAKYSPFDKWTVEGKPVKTFVNGQLIMEDEEIVAKPGSGQIIRRE
ncbi:MAG: dihydroorotase family protein [Candidatus Bathyarchaeota archaeon]|nr:dihydroorotase family protein [Candidatus Bathyarchaeota archaeon A05DMB-5]MDH7557360.1 dihydroorotase family protein [Candidatus Bathyarchaeota archaeon]